MSYDDPYGDDLGGPAQSGPPRQQGSKPAGKKPDLAGYTEVKVRIQKFYAAYPTGALVTTKVKLIGVHELDDKPRVMVKAKAYRTPDDPHPGTGTSWMILPGKTPYTNGSEIENCETSAWGRAIAAVGIAIDQGIASAQEIRMKEGGEIEPPSRSGAEALAEAAREAAGATGTTDPGQSGTEARPGAEQPTEVKEEASPVIAAAQAAADAGGGPAEVIEAAMTQTRQIVRDADNRVIEVTGSAEITGITEAAVEPEVAPKAAKPKKGQGKGPVADPEAKAADAEGEPTQGMTYDEFISAIREKFIPNGAVQSVARELVEQGALPAIGSVRDLTDQQRLTLFYAAIVRNGDDAPAT